MKTIHVLDEHLINKIAAGEVVERPASVVKELVENSIDAHATKITVEIKEGGISFIRITDNGGGIPKDQIKTAFMRHATSKLDAFEDLEDIYTMGFRGEALSSISSVSQVELITKTADDSVGTRIEVHGGKVVSEREIGAVDGTTFIMRNLFYNTPARRSFLKKPATESGYITDIITKIALGHPEISIQYINNSTTILHTTGNGNLKNVVFGVWGKESTQKMVDLTYEKNKFSLKGMIGKPEFNRANRSYENFFINGRYVKSELVGSAVEEAYKGRLMTGKFPVYVINMTVPPNTVDVNVHPTKLEVRFADEDFIHDLLVSAIEGALKKETLIPKVEWDGKKANNFQDVYESVTKEAVKPKVYEPLMMCEDAIEPEAAISIAEKIYGEGKEIRRPYADVVKPAPSAQPPVISSVTEPEAEPPKKEELFFKSYKIAGQIFNTYWIVEQNNSLYVIDQHAAHERILYEELLAKFKSEGVTSQRLLQPIIVCLNEKENQVLLNNKELLETFGFEIELFGKQNTYAIRTVPYLFKNPVASDYFMEVLDRLADQNISNVYDLKLDAIATMSCKAAVKGNDRLDYMEAKALIEKIVKLENPFSCPHGRPTIIEMSRYELEKKFKRV